MEMVDSGEYETPKPELIIMLVKIISFYFNMDHILYFTSSTFKHTKRDNMLSEMNWMLFIS